MINNNPILFYDSGIGGLTTLYECAKLLPNEHFVYFADNSNMPFGSKKAPELQKIIINQVANLIEENMPKMVVLACNTATSLALDNLRKRFKRVVFVGVEPALVPAIKQNKKILLLCTKITKKHSKIVNLALNFCKIDCVCPPNLALEIEENYANFNLQNLSFLKNYKNKIDCVVLGCTHYVFCKKQIEAFFGNDVSVISGNLGVANRVKNLLGLFNIYGTNGGIKFLNKGKTYTKLVNAYVYLMGRL